VSAHDLPIQPLAVLRHISAGWSTLDALCALIDNAVQAGGRTVWIHIRKDEERYGDQRKNNVAAYEVVDDGRGMDAAGLAAALSLAANDPDAYGEHSLSKFGLGLKAAGFSQGEELHLVSSPGGGAPFLKRVVAFDTITPDRYFATAPDLSDDDRALIDAHLPEGRGTIVRIARVHKGGHPSVRDTVREVLWKAGVIYYYFLRDGLTLTVKGARDIPETTVAPFDVLFTEEAEQHEPLNEHEWDGRTVRWIKRPGEPVTLDAEQGVLATVEVTQLPYPPLFDLDAPGLQAATRERYRIGARNYGYYVYRNRRLIAWAEGFDGIVPQDQDLYSFRGRILIDETADEAFNIDLKKARLMLSDEARETLTALTLAYKSKSKKAWKSAGDHLTRRAGEEPNKLSNELADDFEPPILPDEAMATPDEAQEQEQRGQEVQTSIEQRMRREAARAKAEETGQPVAPADVTPEEVVQAARGGTENPAASRIFRVGHVEDNALWEPYFDTDHGGSVRINALHRFGRLVFEENGGNPDLQVLFELLLLTMAQAEVQVQKLTKLSRVDAESLLAAYRRAVSDYLAKLCLDLGDRLPPLAD
jgi:hypothetical protein